MTEYNEDLEIDFAQLDINWRDHSTNYMKWSKKWVDSVAYRDRCKEALDVVRAGLDAKYRKELFDGKKPTEAAISAAITSDDDYKLANQTLLDANEAVNLLASAKGAFEHRKKALEGLTQLWLGGYFSNPKIPAEIKEKFEQGDSEYQKNQKDTLNENPRLKKRKPIRKNKNGNP